MRLILGECLKKLKSIEDNSIDAVITDPPYGLSFMNKKWDYDVPSIEIWKEVLRVLKPGGHLLSFGGTRTYHRMTVNIEDAGFEIRDQIQWLYGSGFPKSHNIQKAGADQWQGWGTALKPANEPICLARKPLKKGLTIAENVLKYGVGGINISATRVGNEPIESGRAGRAKTNSIYKDGLAPQQIKAFAIGRFPSNILLDETAAQSMGEPSRFFYVSKASKYERGENNNHPTVKPVKLMEYLCKLITPPQGTVLDPFMGSGTTGIAAKNLGFDFIGIERDEQYFKIAKKRINQKTIKPKVSELTDDERQLELAL